MVTLHLNVLNKLTKGSVFEENHIKIHEMKPKKNHKAPNPDDEFIQTKYINCQVGQTIVGF